jgi:hypothetical protein
MEQNPPAYYAYEAVPYWVFHWTDAIGRQLAMRLASVLLGMLTVGLTWLLAAELTPRIWVRFVAAAVVALLVAHNLLIERLPGWAAGFAYSMFLMTGGRIGDQLFHDILGHVAERRTRRTEAAPLAPGEFLAFHFDAAAEDTAWLTYLQREALTYGNGEVPHEADRLPVIQAQVDEITRRQAAGLLPADLDPRLLRLLAFALASYPRLLPQITRMTTGRDPADPEFVAAWDAFLRQLAARLEPPRADGR